MLQEQQVAAYKAKETNSIMEKKNMKSEYLI